MTLMILLLLLNQQIAGEHKGDQLSEMVGKNFLDQIANKNYKRAAKLTAEEVNFDGEVIKGEEAITKRLKSMIAAHPAQIHFRRVFYFTGSDALDRFGPLPKRLKGIDLSKSSVLLGQREKGGVAVVLQQVTDSTGSWPRVVALTD